MAARRHILYINEFFHPDFCASAAVLTDQLPLLAQRRPDLRITVLTGNRAWHDPTLVHPARDALGSVEILRVERPPVHRDSLFSRGAGFWAFGRNVLRAAAKLDAPDLVIGTTAPPHGGRIARAIARRHRCPFIYRVLDLYPDVAAALHRAREHGPLFQLWRAVDAAVMRDADAVVTVAQTLTDRLAGVRRLSPQRLHTLYDGLDPARVAAPADDAFRAAHNPQGRFTVQFAGNMGLSHPLDTLLAAAREFANDDGILFQFIGDGPQRRLLVPPPQPNVQWLPYQPAAALGAVLAAADVCVISQHAALWDLALPYRIYATLAAGKPSIFIGDRRCEIADWLLDRDAGLHVPQGDVPALSDAIRRLRDDDALRRQMSASARRLFDDRFQIDGAVAHWQKIIHAVL